MGRDTRGMLSLALALSLSLLFKPPSLCVVTAAWAETPPSSLRDPCNSLPASCPLTLQTLQKSQESKKASTERGGTEPNHSLWELCVHQTKAVGERSPMLHGNGPPLDHTWLSHCPGPLQQGLATCAAEADLHANSWGLSADCAPHSWAASPL